MSSLGVAVVGCGLIGRRRSEIVRSSGLGNLVIVADVDESRAEALAEEQGCLATPEWREAIARDDVEAVIVATTHNWLAPISISALHLDKHVLVEKPMACTMAQAEAIMEAAGRSKTLSGGAGRGKDTEGDRCTVVGVGFNHRHHGAIRKAHALLQQDAIGDILYIRARYGHGGRPGMEKEWRADPALAGGGELLDQGVHVIDLFRWFLGEFVEAFGFTSNYVWNPRGTCPGGVEDNAFALFRTSSGQVASLHASWTEWRNLFSFEVFGRDGYLIVEGLGGSYGAERLRVGRRRIQGGAPDEEVLEFAGPDTSWEAEWREFVGAIQEKRSPRAGVCDGWQALRMVHAVYESGRTGQVVKL